MWHDLGVGVGRRRNLQGRLPLSIAAPGAYAFLHGDQPVSLYDYEAHNYNTHSEAFEDASYSSARLDITDNADTAPNAELTAAYIEANASSASGAWIGKGSAYPVTANETVCLELSVKKQAGSQVYWRSCRLPEQDC